MRAFVLTVAAANLVGCANNEVVDSVAKATQTEGHRYAMEVASQSPFETVELTWSEAMNRMQSRNPQFKKAYHSLIATTEESDFVTRMAGTMKDTACGSIGEVVKPGSLIDTLRDPVTKIPKQLGTLASIKDVPHQMRQEEWQTAAAAIDAQWIMRKMRVKLHRLFQLGELIDSEMQFINSAQPLPPGTDVKIAQAMNAWQTAVRRARLEWIQEVRDIFDAQYYDIHFIPDDTGLTKYRKTIQPDLGNWQRWCQLQRNKDVVSTLGQRHSKDKPLVPGSDLLADKLAIMLDPESNQFHEIRDAATIRNEVRTLASSWQQLKDTQIQAANLEAKHDEYNQGSLDWIASRHRIFDLRCTEIEHASTIWMCDENCWVSR